MWLALIVLGTTTISGAEYDDLLRRVPEDVNTLILLNVESIFESPLGQKENWRQTYTDNFAATPLIVPPHAQRFVLGAAIEVETMVPILEVASVELSDDRSMADIVERIGGVTDELSGLPAVWPRNNLCIVKFAPRQFGMITPASRQAAARWTAHVQQHPVVALTPYLKQATAYAESSGPEILMAMDLNYVLRRQAISAAVQGSDLFRSSDADRVTEVLSSLRGVTLGIRVTDRIYGKLLVDFGEDVSILEPVAKQLVLRALSSAGAMIDEVNDWKSAVQGKRISIEGPLSTEGMRRVFSLTTLDSAILDRRAEPLTTKPPPTPSAPEDITAPKQPEQDVMAAASLRYFRTVNYYLDDLQKPRRSNQLSDIALWIHNFARKIDRLPVRNVDPDLRAYGRMVVEGMYQAVDYLQGIDARAAERQAQVQPDWNVSVGQIPTGRVIQYGPYYRVREYVPFARSNVDIGSALSEQRKIADEEYQAGTDAARQIMDHLRSETQNIRQTMTQRYGREF